MGPKTKAKIGDIYGDWEITEVFKGYKDERGKRIGIKVRVKCIYCGYEKTCTFNTLRSSSPKNKKMCPKCHYSQKKNLVGEVFGKLKVIEEIPKENLPVSSKSTYTYWLCECACGNKRICRRDQLLRGKVRNCGCERTILIKENGPYLKKKNTLYEFSNLFPDISQEELKLKVKKLRVVYDHMKDRCYNPKNNRYKNYGLRGIKVCSEWLENPEKFIIWGISNGYEVGLTIDRKNVNEGYSPENCRWITIKEQQSNRTNNIKLTYNGETKCLSEWSRCLCIGYNKLRTLLKEYSIGEIIENKSKEENKD